MAERYLKQVIVVRKDLTMPAGKLAAMVAHAAMTFILSRLLRPPMNDVQLIFGVSEDEYRWPTELDPGIEQTKQVSMAKIVLAVSNEAELLAVEKKAENAGLVVHRVIDSGYSHNKVGAFACIAIGPDWPERLDPVTGGLRIYR